MASKPPLLRCSGIRRPHAKALEGIYEFHGVIDGRPSYQQAGVSSGNNLWYSQDTGDGPMWVVTPKTSPMGGCPEGAIARSSSRARWPWEIETWTVCGRTKKFVASHDMRFTPLHPAAELRVEVPPSDTLRSLGVEIPRVPTGAQSRAQTISLGGKSAPSTALLRISGEVNGRCCYRQAGGGLLRLFWMPKKIAPPNGAVAEYLSRTQAETTWDSFGASNTFDKLPRAGDGDFPPAVMGGCWMLAVVKESEEGDDGGIQHVVARSLVDDGCTWASQWPWEVEASGWELSNGRTAGLSDGAALWGPADGRIIVHMTSPPVIVHAGDDRGVSAALPGKYEARGMLNGRVYYFQRLEDISLDRSTGPKCLWFAEERGQWLVTDPGNLGNSHALVLARIGSRTWWPWEAHVGGSTSAASCGAAPFASLPVWHGGAAVLASSRVRWEVPDPETGVFRYSDGMEVNLACIDRCAVRANQAATYPFLGRYEKAGLLASRPFFLQSQSSIEARQGSMESDRRDEDDDLDGPPPTSLPARFALWYSEDRDQWVVTEDFRLLEGLQVSARAADSAWLPWEVGVPKSSAAGFTWEVADGQGGFVMDPFLRIEAIPDDAEEDEEEEEEDDGEDN